MNNRTKNPFHTPPCVGRCSTVYGDAVCRGCKRFDHEVTHWNQYTGDQKERVWRRIESLVSQVLPRWVRIEDVDLLEKHLQTQGWRYPKHLSPNAWALVCMENFQLEWEDLPQLCGLRLHPKAQHIAKQGKKALLLSIQSDLYQVSCAYHQRQVQSLGTRVAAQSL